MTYFKKFKDFEVEFGDRTIISGRNRSGKSSIFDAFMWLLFGKDSLGATDFDIKTLDENGDVIEKVDHEVYGELMINGSLTTLKRILREKWDRSGETLKGHETVCFFDGVPVSVGDYQERIKDIIDENIFRQITNTGYFHTLKRDERRSVLVALAGDLSDEVISDGKYDDIVELLKKNTSEDLKKKIATEIKKIEGEKDDIPVRIDEVMKRMPEAVDFVAIEKQIARKKEELKGLDKVLSDRQEEVKAKIEKANEDRKKIGELRLKQQDILNEAELKAQKDANERNKEFFNFVEIKNDKKEKAKRAETRVLNKKSELSEVQSSLESAKKEREKFVEQWKEENEKVYSGDEQDSCSFCGHVFTEEEKFETRRSGEGEFNKRKLERLNEINQKGLSVKEKILGFEKTISELEQELLSLKEDHEKAVQELNEMNLAPAEVKPKPVVKEEIEEWVDLEKQINSITIEEVRQDNSDLTEKRNQINEEIVSLTVELNKKQVIENSFKRIEDLEKEQLKLAQEIANQRLIEDRLLEFNKLKMGEVDKRVNGMFKIVTFKLFDKTIGGNDIETCETLINGVRYWSANNESRINGGLDIINAICKHHGVYAPIFVDNAEGINELIPTDSQMIELRVTEGDLLIE